MEAEDRSDLKDFLDEFKTMIDTAFNQNREWFPDELFELLREAWDDLEKTFDAVKEAIESGEYDTILDAEGLSGMQRRTKRAVWNAVRGEVDRERKARPRGGFLRSLARLFGWSGHLLRAFKTALGVANDILESIGKAIPPAGAVKEFKGIFEGALSLKEQAGGTISRFFRRIF